MMTNAMRTRACRFVTAIFMALAGSAVLAVPANAANGPSSLTVTVHWGPRENAAWTLTCDPVGGTHPNRTRACAFLDGLPDAFSTKPTGLMCTMIYSGPERAHVVGNWKGTPVDAAFARNDGCATAKWAEYLPLFTDPAVVPVSGRVDLGPTCPVQQPGQVCETLGAPATVTATSGTRHRTTKANAQGFLMRLPRGVWHVTADAGMHCPTVRVDLRKGRAPKPIVIACDTGIR